MSLLAVSEDNKGYTIIEILLVVAIIAIIGATSISMGTGFLTRNNLKNKTNELVSSLAVARISSISGKEDSPWGVNINSSSITLFAGTSYATRDSAFDQNFSIPSSIDISVVEIVFNKLTGNPNSTANIVISGSGVDANTVIVNEVGSVDVI